MSSSVLFQVAGLAAVTATKLITVLTRRGDCVSGMYQACIKYVIKVTVLYVSGMYHLAERPIATTGGA
jgi:hypothetical protein